VTRLTAEANASRRTVDFSADAYKGSAYRQNSYSLGGRYQFGGAASVGLAYRDTQTTSPRSNFGNDRRDIDLTANWAPSGLSSVNARLSRTRSDYDIQTQNNFSGTTGELQGSSQVTGKLKLSARLARDTGLSYSLFSFGSASSTANFNRTTTEARLAADYDFSSKIALTTSASQYRRDLSTALAANFTLGGKDRTTLLSLGGRWAPTRSVQLGCQIDHERRSTSGSNNSISSDISTSVSVPYGSQAYSCYGQFTIQ